MQSEIEQAIDEDRLDVLEQLYASQQADMSHALQYAASMGHLFGVRYIHQQVDGIDIKEYEEAAVNACQTENWDIVHYLIDRELVRLLDILGAAIHHGFDSTIHHFLEIPEGLEHHEWQVVLHSAIRRHNNSIALHLVHSDLNLNLNEAYEIAREEGTDYIETILRARVHPYPLLEPDRRYPHGKL